MRIALIFFLTLLSLTLRSQEKADSLPEVVVINGEEFYLQEIIKGTTLYSVSKFYGITLDDLKKANPTVSKEMRIGDTLRIPLSAIETFQEDKEQSDGNYLIHEVQRKNTLYSIAKEYDLEISEIIAANPEVEEKGLKKGMKLKIPIAKLKEEPSMDTYIEPSATSPYITHRVMPKETLYSLSKTYSVSVDSILKVNNGLEQGLKVNQLITIPILKDYSDSVEIDIEFDSSAIKADYTVSLLLPFYLDELRKAEDTTSKSSQRLYQQLFKKAQYGIDLYNGFKMAADTLSKQGLRIELRVFDTANDTAKLRKLIADSALQGSDLLVGPLFFDEFVLASDYAKKEGINIVSPVKQSNKILLGNSYVSKVSSSDPVLLKSLSAYIADSLSKENLLLVFPDHIKERSNVDMIKRTYFDRIENNYDSVMLSVPKEIIWDPKNYEELSKKLDSNRRNIIIAPSTEQAFVSSLMTKLNREEDRSITLIGIEDWRNYDYLEVEYLMNLNVHIMVSDFIDHKDEEVLLFEKEYKRINNMPADQFSYLGYDIGMYYLSLLKEYGANFQSMLLEYKKEYLSRKFHFFKTGIESGYENHSAILLRYKDFELQRVR